MISDKRLVTKSFPVKLCVWIFRQAPEKKSAEKLPAKIQKKTADKKAKQKAK